MSARQETGRALPSWFKALCAHAAVRAELAPSCRASYADPGYHLAIHWWGELEGSNRSNAAKALKQIRHHDPAAVVAWVGRFFPEFLAQVPAQRRIVFARGFLRRGAE